MVAGGSQTSGMAEIRGIDIDKLLKGFADEEILFKRFVSVTPTSAREIRWYKKTSGILDSTDTTGMSTSRLANVAELATPESIEQSVTRITSHVRKYMADSIVMSDEDIKDSDPDILGMNIRDVLRAVNRQTDIRIWDVATESRGLTGQTITYRATSGAWTGGTTAAYPIHDILAAKQLIRAEGEIPEGGNLLLNAMGHRNLLIHLISARGSSIPQFASQKVVTGILHEILGLNVVVSEHITDGYGLIGNMKKAVTWKTFTPLKSATIVDPGIGTKIRVWEEGEAILPYPKALCLLSGTGTA